MPSLSVFSGSCVLVEEEVDRVPNECEPRELDHEHDDREHDDDGIEARRSPGRRRDERPLIDAGPIYDAGDASGS